MKLLITGGTGFVGSAILARAAAESEFSTVSAVRSGSSSVSMADQICKIAGLAEGTDWSTCLQDVDVVVHCAARTHVMREEAVDPLAEFRSVNVEGTLGLARQAARAGVRRFVFLSSVKVHGECTDGMHPYQESDALRPEDPYGVSKAEAEAGLKQICAESDMEYVIVRPPLVYGRGVKGNFSTLIRLAGLPVPLPFGAVRNQRSMVYIENLVDLVFAVIRHPAAGNEEFLVCDGDDLSTTRLLQLLRQALGRRPMLLPVPEKLLSLVFGILGKQDLAGRVMGFLQVDCSKARELIGWAPPFTAEYGIRHTIGGETGAKTHDS